jgi:hypothetical protein
MSILSISNKYKKPKIYCIVSTLLFFLCFQILSCSTKKAEYDGVWKIESASDIQNLLDMGLVIKLVINTKSKEMKLWTYVNGEGTLQNTGELYYFSDGQFLFHLPDLEPEHYGRIIQGKLTLIDNKLHYSTGLRNDWVFIKE